MIKNQERKASGLDPLVTGRKSLSSYFCHVDIEKCDIHTLNVNKVDVFISLESNGFEYNTTLL